MWRATFIMLFKPLSQIASRTDIRVCWARAGLRQVHVVHHKAGAGDEARTRDVHLGKVVLYQLSYTRSVMRKSCSTLGLQQILKSVTFVLILISDTDTVRSIMKNNVWEKVSRSIGLYRYIPNGRYFAHVRYKGKLYRRSLETTDIALAKRRLADYKRTLDRTDPAQGNKSFAA